MRTESALASGVATAGTTLRYRGGRKRGGGLGLALSLAAAALILSLLVLSRLSGHSFSQA
jgi:hypothetical protein